MLLSPRMAMMALPRVLLRSIVARRVASYGLYLFGGIAVAIAITSIAGCGDSNTRCFTSTRVVKLNEKRISLDKGPTYTLSRTTTTTIDTREE